MVSEIQSQSDETLDYEEAQNWAVKLFGPINIFQIWIPQLGFMRALRIGDSLTMTRDCQPRFGLSLGHSVIIEADWVEFALPRELPADVTVQYPLIGQWDAYGIKTQIFKGGQSAEILLDEELVRTFLIDNAPNSSTLRGDQEIIFWAGIRNHEGELASLACITLWESGARMLSSVATRIDLRGQGFAQKLIREILSLAAERGVGQVGLAVEAHNLAAIKVYENIGFTSLGKFNSFRKN
jgi:GNAT superfamily N-acetyltransferase